MDGYVTLGIIVKPYGLKGEILVRCLTSFPKERFKPKREYALINPKTGETRKAALSSARYSGDRLYLAFEGINAPEDAATLRSFEVALPAEEAPIPEGYVRLADLIGMSVIDDATEETIGTVQDVLCYGKTPTIKVDGPKGPFTFPLAFGPFVTDISEERKEIRIRVIPGLI